MPPSTSGKDARRYMVVAGIPACRRAGLPSPAERTSRKLQRFGKLGRRERIHVFIRAAGMPPSTSGKDARCYMVVAGIPACRRAGLPSPAERTSRKLQRFGKLGRRERIRVFIRAAGMPPSTSGKDARRYMVAAGIPACRRAGLPSPAEETSANPQRLKPVSITMQFTKYDV